MTRRSLSRAQRPPLGSRNSPSAARSRAETSTTSTWEAGLGPGDMFTITGLPVHDETTGRRIGSVDATETILSAWHDGTVIQEATYRLRGGTVTVSGALRHTDHPTPPARHRRNRRLPRRHRTTHRPPRGRRPQRDDLPARPHPIDRPASNRVSGGMGQPIGLHRPSRRRSSDPLRAGVASRDKAVPETTRFGHATGTSLRRQLDLRLSPRGRAFGRGRRPYLRSRHGDFWWSVVGVGTVVELSRIRNHFALPDARGVIFMRATLKCSLP